MRQSRPLLHVVLMARILKPSQSAAAECAKALSKGRAVIYPTETVYGLGVDATNRKAVRSLFEIKKRDPKKPVSVAVASLSQAKRIAEFNKSAIALAKSFLPGPMTIVLRSRVSLPQITARGKIGIRIPKNSFVLLMLKKFGKPVTSTSANISGLKSASDTDQLDASLVPLVDILIDGGETKHKTESTVVDASLAKPKILREGAISAGQIARVLKGIHA